MLYDDDNFAGNVDDGDVNDDDDDDDDGDDVGLMMMMMPHNSTILNPSSIIIIFVSMIHSFQCVIMVSASISSGGHALYRR